MIRKFLGSFASSAAIGAMLFAAPAPAHAREVVAFRDNAAAGTIIIKTSERRLYYVMGDGRAVRYPVDAIEQWVAARAITRGPTAA